MAASSKTRRAKPLRVTLDWRFTAILLLAIIATMFYLWKPWASGDSSKTLTVQGEATVESVPDSFLFQPVFENADLKKVNAAGNEAVAQLKKLGVKDSDIKASVHSSAQDLPEPETKSLIAPSHPRTNSSYIIAATVEHKALAQKVADYLATTTATGEIAPSATFSSATAARLGLEARSLAADDAKAKAVVLAKQLGGRVGKVVSISEAGSGPGIYPLKESATDGSAISSEGPTVQPGSNKISYSFSVVFELK